MFRRYPVSNLLRRIKKGNVGKTEFGPQCVYTQTRKPKLHEVPKIKQRSLLLPPPPKVDEGCFHVCLSVCLSVSKKSQKGGRIRRKFGGQVGCATRINGFDFD